MASDARPFLSSASPAADETMDDDDVEALAAKTSDEMRSILHQLSGDDDRGAAPASSDEKSDDGMAALASRAAALASARVPDYAGSIKNENDRLREKYGERFVIGDEDDDCGLAEDSNGIVLAERTSQILSNFQDYVSGIGGEAPGEAGKTILEGGGVGGGGGEEDATKSSVAGAIRSDNKTRLLEGEGGLSSTRSVGSDGSEAKLHREWAHDGYTTTGASLGANVQNLHQLRLEGWDDEDPDSNIALVSRGQRYTHPLIQSRRVMFGLLNCVVVTSIVLGVSLGVSNRNKRAAQGLEDLKSYGEDGGGGGGNQGKVEDWWTNDQLHVTIGLPDKSEDDAEKKVDTAAGSDNAPLPSSPVSKEDMITYQAALAKYQPDEYNREEGWLGSTYLDAFTFCGQKQLDICPYDAVCPLGTDTQPLGGYKERLEGSWVPISDAADDWVQLSFENACVRWSNEHAEGPQWGVEGGEDADMVRHVMCCVPTDEEAPEDARVDVPGVHGKGGGEVGDPDFPTYQKVAEQFMPLEFDRTRGWTGKTYVEGLQFCGAMAGYEICPYEAVCPLGNDSTPLGGNKEDEKESWVPILDAANEWVQIGEENSCVRYSSQHGDIPKWSATGKGSEEITQHVMCCLLTKNYMVSGEENEPQHPSYETVSVSDVDPLFMAYEEAAEKYALKEFSRDDGWDGHTYAQAAYFCSNDVDSDDEYEICPFDAICPLGSDSEPLGGYKMSYEGDVWLPVSDMRNDWVKVTQSDPCIRFSGLNPSPPDWGVTGQGSEGITGYIACCLKQEGVDEDVDVDVDVDEDEDVGGGEVDEAKLELYKMEMAYKQSAETFMPVPYDREKGWMGKTYQDAFTFCGQQGGSTLCPYMAICPMGPDTQPLGGYKEDSVDDDGGQWVPILMPRGDQEGWVLVSTASACHLYGEEHPSAPAWGLDGEDDEEDRTGNLFCCADLGEGMTEEEAKAKAAADEAAAKAKAQYTMSQEEAQHMAAEAEAKAKFEMKQSPDYKYHYDMAYKHAVETYMPVDFDREMGWSGKTYQDAFIFCGQREGGTLCPYVAVCPMGPGEKPIGGYKELVDERGAWVPIRANGDGDTGNDWVEVTEGDACRRYNPHPTDPGPEWGLTGDDDEEMTRNIVCCRDVGQEMTESEAESIAAQKMEAYAAAQEAESYAAQQAALREANEQAMEASLGLAYGRAVDRFSPGAYRREDGWEGETYLDAVRFCAGSMEGYEICPYQALCPLGPGREPIVGAFVNPTDEDGPAWVPIADDANDWVDLSHGNACARYTAEGEEKPKWGMTGGGGATLTPLVVCCELSIKGTAVEGFLYEVAATEHLPEWHDRSGGWTGTAYDEAVDFCVNTKGKFMCPYEAHCPMADLGAPMGGVRDDGGPMGSWAPINDVHNSWVSVGPDNTCKFYSIVWGQQPEWGLTGAGSEEATRHVMCCGAEKELGDGQKEGVADLAAQGLTLPPSARPTPSPTPGQTPDPIPFPTRLPTSLPTPLPTPYPTPPPTPLPSRDSTPPPTPYPTPLPTPRPSNRPTLPLISGALGTALDAYKTVEKYDPVWYDRSDGWAGRTYDEAFTFCAGKGSNHDICPYEVICPGGALSLPYGGSKPGFGGSWAPINEPFNSWVQVGDRQVCVLYANLNPEDHPTWGLTGVDDEDITRHVACCNMDGAQDAAATGSAVVDAYSAAIERYEPRWFDREDGWEGATYVAALAFCASRDSSTMVCPYEAICPEGEGGAPVGGSSGTEAAWAPIMDVPNGWVQTGMVEEGGMSDSCAEYNDLRATPPLWGILGNSPVDLTPRVMCCREPADGVIAQDVLLNAPSSSVAIAETTEEQDVLEEMNPVWFGRRQGYHGATWDEASDFCRAVGDMVLCPRSAYCPGGSQNELFLQKDPFEGEQWAPAASEYGAGKENWISVGNDRNACATHEELGLSRPTWALDGSRQELRENVLCCQNPKYLAKEQSMKKDLNPIWMDTSHGWEGGSHDDAVRFCKGFSNRKLCPYTAYCPHGPGQPVMGGHATDFNTEGEQWAPLFGEAGHWVMIGQKYANRATTCMNSEGLGGNAPPEWGADMKKYIMCCSF